MLIGLGIQALVTLGLLAWYVQQRRRVLQKLRQLSEQQEIWQGQTSRFMSDCEIILQQFSRSLKRKGGGLPRAVADSNWGPAPRLRLVEEETKVPTPSETEALTSDSRRTKRDQAIRLAQSGSTAGEIARRLMLPLGEIELMLSLARVSGGSWTYR